MFSPHETDRKRRRQALFFALCVAPSLATLGWMGAKLRPGGDVRTARAIEAALLIPATVHGACEPRPGVVRCETTTLSDPATATRLLEMQAIVSQLQGKRRTLHIRRVEIDATVLPTLATFVGEWLADQRLVGDAAIDELVVTGGSSDAELDRPAASPNEHAISPSANWTLHDVRVRLDGGAENGSSTRRLALIGRSQSDAPQFALRVERRPSDGGETSQSVVLTCGEPLPGWVLGAIDWPLAPWSQALVRGQVRWNFVGDELSSAWLCGGADRLDAAKLIPPSSPHAMQGTARLSDALVRWSAGGVESLSGYVEIDGGTCSASLVAAAVEWLYCKPVDGQPIAATDEPIAFDRIACWFHFDELGLTVWGGDTTENTRSCVLAMRDGQPWLREPEYENVFAGRWVACLHPANGSWLPASREAVDAANRLPLPKGAKPTILRK